MIVIEKISDGIPLKTESIKHFLVVIFIKMPSFFAIFFTLFFLYLDISSGHRLRSFPILSTLFYSYIGSILFTPLFGLCYNFYSNIYGNKKDSNKILPLIDSEYSRIKNYLVEKYQNPLIYFDVEPFGLNIQHLSWSKVIGYPNFCAFNGRDFFMTNKQGEMVKFNWNDVREWSGGSQEGGMMIGTNAQGIFKARAYNKIQRQKNAKESGFFVTIKDVNCPNWQFMTADKALQNKWMEIFRQVNDGTLTLQA